MPRRSILSATERDNLMALPVGEDDLIRHYSFTESDLSLIRQRRGDANRMGFAVQLCLLLYPGYALEVDMPVPDPVIDWIAGQIRSDAAAWPQYGVRDETRREHFQELRAYLSLSAFGLADFRTLVHSLADLAMQTDKGLILAAQALDTLQSTREQRTRDFIAEFCPNYTLLKEMIPQRVAYADVAELGMALDELPVKDKLAIKEAQELFKEIWA